MTIEGGGRLDAPRLLRRRVGAMRGFAAALVLGIALLPTLAAGQASAMDAGQAALNAGQAAPNPGQVLVMLRSPPPHARVDASYGGAGYGDAAREHSQARIASRIAAAHGFSVVSQWPMPSLGVDCIAMSLPPGAGLADGIARLQAHGEVVWAQPLNEFKAQGHADPLYAMQPAATQWHLDELHAVATGRRVRVALIDSGVDTSHPDLANAVETHRNFVDGRPYAAESHGTAAAGLIAARSDNGIGMVGIAPEARLLMLRACWEVNVQHTACNSLSLAKALNFAIEQGAEIINMSLSGPNDLLIGRLIDVALSRRQQVIAAVDAESADGGFPAAHPGVIAVTAAPFAGLPGAWAAPARDLPTTLPSGRWGMVSGASFAAAQVSGLIAVLDQADADRKVGVGAGGGSKFRLVRLPGDAIDALASLMRAPSDSKAGPPHSTHVVAATLVVGRP